MDTRSIILPQNTTCKHYRSVLGHFGNITEVSGHFGSAAEVSCCRNVLLPKCPVTDPTIRCFATQACLETIRTYRRGISMMRTTYFSATLSAARLVSRSRRREYEIELWRASRWRTDDHCRVWGSGASNVPQQNAHVMCLKWICDKVPSETERRKHTSILW